MYSAQLKRLVKLLITCLHISACVAQFYCPSNFNTDYETDERVTVRTALGDVTGKVYESESGFRADVFQGIPYATQQRFQPSQVATQFAGGALDATAMQPICYQFQVLGDYEAGDEEVVETEDCLLLTIVAPRQKGPAPYPVLVWIHGGGFVMGAGNAQRMDGIVDNYAARGIVFVTVQYRLGPLGFLYQQRGPNNLGLYDQLNAVEFVKRHIGSFGGDPNRVTLMGESAGGISVSYLYSKLRAPAIQGAVVMSGSQFLGEGVAPQMAAALDLARETGCPSARLAACLRNIAVERLRELTLDTGRNSTSMRFAPVPDGDVVRRDRTAYLQRARGNVLIGTTTDEGALFVGMAASANATAPNRDTLAAVVAGYVSGMAGVRNKALVSRLALHKYYDATELAAQTDPPGFLRAQADIMGDTSFHVPAIMEARLTASNPANKVWLYEFDGYRPAMYTVPGLELRGPYHAGDLIYAFTSPLLALAGRNATYRFDAEDCRIAEKFSGAIAHFAKTGNVDTWDGKRWPRIVADAPSQYMNIKAAPDLRTDFHRAAELFWTDLVPDVDTCC